MNHVSHATFGTWISAYFAPQSKIIQQVCCRYLFPTCTTTSCIYKAFSLEHNFKIYL